MPVHIEKKYAIEGAQVTGWLIQHQVDKLEELNEEALDNLLVDIARLTTMVTVLKMMKYEIITK